MKITQINGYTETPSGRSQVSITVESNDKSIPGLISSVLALFASQASYDEDNAAREAMQKARDEVVQAVAQAAPNEPAAPAAEPAAKASRTRRPRTNPDAAPAVETPAEAPAAEPVVEQRRRTRGTAEPAQPEVKVITDADLAKACSNAAAVIGIEVVQAVIADFHVKSMQELAVDVRERFLAELNDEIELAKAELAGK